jgi:class 3 adenylate cyclase/streptogramin lyase
VSELPSGTVSLLFTDIEGSTQLQHMLGERYQEVVAEHRRILEEAFAAHWGTIVDRQTESYFVAFPRARHAVQAAADAQRALAGHPWPDGVQVKVRMGIHAGDPEVADDRYVGLAVARAARICASAHGGQVLLSSSARALLSDDQQASLRNLGAYRLKDFAAPEPISQLVVDGLPSQFPRLRTEATPDRRKQLLLAAGALLVAGAIAGAVVALAGGGSSATVGPTSLAIVDPRSNRVSDAIDIGFKSHLIAAGAGHIWVVNPTGSTLLKIDPRTHSVQTIGIAVGAGDVPFGLAVGDGAVWVAVLRGEREVVLELGPEVGDLRRVIPYGRRGTSPTLSRFQPLTVGGGAVWAIDPAGGGLWRIDPHGGKSRELAEGLDALSVAAASGTVVVGGSSSVTELDASTGVELGSRPIGPPGETASVAIGPTGVWSVASSRQTLSRLDPQSLSTIETFPVGHGASSVAVGQGTVWVTNSGDGTVSRVDLRGGKSRLIHLGRQVPGGVVAAYGAVWTSPGEPQS